MSCNKIDDLNKKRFVFASWKRNKIDVEKKYRANIKLTVMSRVGLIRDITAVISSFNILIVDVRMEGDNNKMHDDFFTLEFDDPKKFDVLLDKLENIEGVEKVLKI
jgi:(p)ppGpp synthase/HD superfamily hydrolase